MKKSTYLTILLLIWVNFWNIKPFGGNINSDYTQILIILYLIAGTIIYSKNRIRFAVKIYKPMSFIFLGIFLSMLPANIYYGQTFLQSLISYRSIYFLLSIYFFFRISFTQNDIFKGIHIFAVLLAIMYVIKMATPGLFYFSTRVLELQESEGYTMGMGGFALITIPLFMRLQILREKFSTQNLLWILFYLMIFILMQNRSILFGSLLITGYQLIKMKSKYRYVIITICIGLFFYLGMDIINNLIIETEEQLADSEYNRNKALAYFIAATTQDWFTTLLGCGFISAHVSPIMQNLMDNGIFNSDVGLVGFWNQYGVIPVITILYIFISTLRTKEMPQYMKMLAILHLSCILTLEYYGNYISMSRFIFFYYMYFYYKNRIKLNKCSV